MSGYLDFTRTGYEPVDKIIEVIEDAGRAYHHTSEWSEGDWSGDKPYLERIDDAINEARAQLTTLTAKLEAAEKDAARYRWLRNHDPFEQLGAFTPYAIKGQTMEFIQGDELDAAIDAAMKNGKG